MICIHRPNMNHFRKIYTCMIDTLARTVQITFMQKILMPQTRVFDCNQVYTTQQIQTYKDFFHHKDNWSQFATIVNMLQLQEMVRLQKQCIYWELWSK